MNKFNLRVYGIFLNDEKQLLVSDEYIRGEQTNGRANGIAK